MLSAFFFIYMKKIITTLLLFVFATLAFAQVNCYRIYLHDKANSPYSVERPQEFLSQRSIDKRARYDIEITERDLPVNPAYKNEILQVDTCVHILSTSKWTNTLAIWCPQEDKLQDVENLYFVDSIKPVGYYPALENHQEDVTFGATGDLNEPDTLSYGLGFDQIALHNGQLLHQQGYRGDGMLIAMLDAGWLLFDQFFGFQSLYDNGQIWGTYNFIPGMDNVYLGHTHGTSCASIILSSIFSPLDTLVGTAPNANMVFIRTEDPDHEQLIEEDFWAAGAELADSLGADVITSSLGYTQFDNPDFAFDYSSCDGRTSIASQVATMAAHSGMVVCVAAGNDGYNAWHKLSRPGDAEDVLCVGAVDVDSVYAPFSSCGPSFDGRVKPDVASCGWDTYVANVGWDEDHYYMALSQGSGTSYATPLLAGLATCLWQALPQLTAVEVMQIIREAGHQYTAPDTLMGYGIPNFYQAWLEHRADTLVSVTEQTIPSSAFCVYPNPCQSWLTVENPESTYINICIYDLMGRVMYADGGFSREGKRTFNTENWPSGVYFVRVQQKCGNAEILKIVRE